MKEMLEYRQRVSDLNKASLVARADYDTAKANNDTRRSAILRKIWIHRQKREVINRKGKQLDLGASRIDPRKLERIRRHLFVVDDGAKREIIRLQKKIGEGDRQEESKRKEAEEKVAKIDSRVMSASRKMFPPGGARPRPRRQGGQARTIPKKVSSGQMRIIVSQLGRIGKRLKASGGGLGKALKTRLHAFKAGGTTLVVSITRGDRGISALSAVMTRGGSSSRFQAKRSAL